VFLLKGRQVEWGFGHIPYLQDLIERRWQNGFDFNKKTRPT